MDTLSAAGLNQTEAKCYRALLTKKQWLASELAKNVNETRTNAYKILDNLVALELAERLKDSKKFRYRAKHPSRLIELAHEIRTKQERAERALELQSQELLEKYVKVNEQAGVRHYQGEAELKEIYFDQVKSGEPIYIIRPDYNMDLYDFDYMTEIRHMARQAGLKRYAITPDREQAPANYKESDPYMLLTRTWLRADEYTAPVEWNAYGNKVAIMSFGNEAVGMIIESPQIAEAFRQLYRLLERGLRLQPGYDKLPLHARYTGSTGANSDSA